ncbi:MAG: NAD-glutamate dehydrogenase [Ghiorsea sp.]|nr:NAD-glutamate dehydrogenase [Ghiorsea sp.]
MRKLRDSLIQLFQDSWRDSAPPKRVQALVVEQAEQLLENSDAQFGVGCRVLSHGALHRHIMVVHCPDQAFYPDAIRAYLQKQSIQPIQQESLLFALGDGVVHGIQAQISGANKALLLVFHFSVTTTENIGQVEKDIQHILQGVHQSVVDFPAMRSELERIAIYLSHDDPANAALLQWMIEDHYLFYGLYYLNHTRKNKGLCKHKRLLSWLLPGSAEELAGIEGSSKPSMQWFHLSSLFSHLYSAANVRAVRLCWAEEDGLHCAVLIGHFSRGARYINGSALPKLGDVWQGMTHDVALQQSAFYQREMRLLFDRTPKSMLHSIPVLQWFKPFKSIIDMNSPTQVVLSRLIPTEGNVEYLLIAVDRHRFGEDIWENMQRVIAKLNMRLFGSELYSVGAIQMIFVAVQTEQWQPMDKIQLLINQCIIFWKDRAKQALLQASLPTALLHDGLLELNGISHLYQDQFTSDQFVKDLILREKLKQDGAVRVRLTLHHDLERQMIEVHVITPYTLPLGVMTEKLNAFALVTMEQALIPFHQQTQTMHICRFRCVAPEQLHTEGLPRLRQGIQAVFNQMADHDPLNALVILCGLNVRDVMVLITLRNHVAQLIPEVSTQALSEMMIKHHKVSRYIFRIFEAKHRPSMPNTAETQARAKFTNAMLDVQSLKEDTWLRSLAAVVDSSLRSNAWIRDQGQAVAIKIDPSQLDFVVHPKPYREIFVHGVCVEGVHLRAGAIARGGLRYSDRPTDFRTEVLELMTTQVVKNGQIVPTGAKGGFVVRDGEGADFVLAQYHQFIHALLSITDNRVEGELVPPEGVQVAEQDSDDTYLVVAADKGTARYSDDANAEALDANFWLGDAFASGGSHGYDHKAFGITAKGAWVCAAHHFARQGINLWQDEVTAVGIGDMGGDVFGNGMLLNANLKLVAAFNHIHIFLDPQPNVQAAFAERTRLFQAVKGWGDYDISLISQGGGVFDRASKNIQISQEVQAVLGMDMDECSGEALIRAILQAPVDLLYNGGIGTYVKASFETDVDAQDPANNAVRVDANTLRCKVLSEGGNLGLTQAARIEYAQAGGLINTDAIDNAAGVNMSDHEVNLKILLTDEPFKRRNQRLKQVAEFVAEQCLQDNKEQAIALSLTEQTAEHHLPRLYHLQQQLFADNYLYGMTEDAADFVLRPVFSEWLGHEKNRVHQALDAVVFREQSVFGDMFLKAYFPKPLQKNFALAIANHPLANDIAHTRITSYIVNRYGITSIHYLQNLTASSIEDVVQVVLMADMLLGTQSIYDDFLRHSGHDLAGWYQVQQQVLNFAAGLLLLDEHMQVNQAWLKTMQRGLVSFAKKRGVVVIDLSGLATAIPLCEAIKKPLHRCLAATQDCIDTLPFAPLEESLRSTLWGNHDAHALRCEWLGRLMRMKKQAARQMLLVSRQKKQKLVQAWQQHPLQVKLESLLASREGLTDEELRLRYILAMTHLQSIVECDCNLA